MLIKLDNGDYVNTAFIEELYRDKAENRPHWDKSGNQLHWGIVFRDDFSTITDADKDRIVAAMTEAKRVKDGNYWR